MKRHSRLILILFLLQTFFITSGNAQSPFEVQSGQLYNQEPSGEARKHPTKGPFSIQDSHVYLRIDWRGYQAGKEYRYDWVAPDGKVASSYANKRKSNSNGGSWARITSQKLYDNGPGRWTVRFYYDSQLKHKSSFEFQVPGQFTHLMYAPDYGNLEAGVIVAVHSSSYNPIEYFHFFKPLAVQKHMVLVAPYFPKKDFHYQTVYLDQPRADKHLQQILDEVQMNTGANTDRLIMYGQSAGAQFVHRYLLAHPDKIVRMVVSAPGWWTFPSSKIAYPYGTGPYRRLPSDVRFQIPGSLQVPVMVVVGEKDVLRTANVNQSQRADAQGQNRLERSVHWMNTMAGEALDKGVDFRYTYHLAEGASHGNVRGRTQKQVFDYLSRINEKQDSIAWNMQHLKENSATQSLLIRVRTKNTPRQILMGKSATDLRPLPSAHWQYKNGIYSTVIAHPYPTSASILYARIKLSDGSLSNLQGLPGS